MIRLTGTLTCATPEDLASVETYLPDHIHLSRAEPGCLTFNVMQSDDPMVWLLDESYVDHAALEAHRHRTRGSVWWQKSLHIRRDISVQPAK